MTNTQTQVNGKASAVFELGTKDNVIQIAVEAADKSYTRIYSVTINRAPSSNALLSSLTTSSGAVTPAFSPAATAYEINVDTFTASISVTASVYEPNAKMTVNGSAQASGAASKPIALNVGTNTITIAVTAQDGAALQSYSLTVNRAPSANAQLSSLTTSSGPVTPAFSPSRTSYEMNVSNNTRAISVTASVYEPTAVLTINGVKLSSGAASEPYSLIEGANSFNVLVTAQDGTTKQNYTLIVNRAKDSKKPSGTSTTSPAAPTTPAPGQQQPDTTLPTNSNAPAVEIVVDGVKQDKLATASTDKAGDQTVTTVSLIPEQSDHHSGERKQRCRDRPANRSNGQVYGVKGCGSRNSNRPRYVYTACQPDEN
jgi:hypothetical protein